MVINSLEHQLKSILRNSLGYSRSTRFCQKLSDLDYLYLHLQRVLGVYSSGREYLQERNESGDHKEIARATYFGSLHSTRRSRMARESANGVYRMIGKELQNTGVDHLKKFSELNEYEIISFDGHYRTHACHASKDSKDRYRAVGGIYGMNMRNGLIQSLVTTDFETNKKHELRAFKEYFRMNPFSDKKVISIVDMAYWDAKFWQTAKRSKADENETYIITLMKENLAPIKEIPLNFDKEHAYNIGVESVTKVTFKSKASATKIVYRDPETKKEYVYLTTLGSEIQPGLIAHLYLWRWKIEKVFNVFKSKLKELKAWADGETSEDAQAAIISIAYNFLVRTQDYSLAKEGVFEIKLAQKQKKIIANRSKSATKKGHFLHPLVQIPHKLYQMSAQFIRCFRNNYKRGLPWPHLISIFEQAMLRYL